MSKKSAGTLLGAILVAGAAAGVIKYLKDYGGASYTREDEIKNVKDSSVKVKEAAKRTYIAIRDKGDVKTAAGDLARAAGRVASDAGNMAVTAGNGAYEAAKTIKEQYEEDPEGAKAAIKSNLKEMGGNIAESARTYAGNIKEKAHAACSGGEETADATVPDFTGEAADITEPDFTEEEAVDAAGAGSFEEETFDISGKEDTFSFDDEGGEENTESARVEIDFTDSEETRDEKPSIEISDEG